MHSQQEQGGHEPEVNYDTWMLNLRFVLITLVFIATGIEPVMERFGLLGGLHAWIFIFHMPLFAYVTGYFSRNTLLGRSGLKVIVSIAVQYIIFQTLYSSLDVLFFHVPGQKHSFFIPYLMLWFLVAHIGWRCLVRLMCALGIKHPVAVSLCLGVAAGYLGTDGSWLSFSRMFVFLPFFAAGYAVHPAKLLAFISGKGRIIQAGISLIVLAAVPALMWHGTPDWLYGKFTYAEMGSFGPAAAMIRLGCYVLQIWASLAVLALIPRRQSILTSLGSRTLYVFLLHGLFVRSAISLGLYDFVQHTGDVVILAAVILIMTVALSLPQTRQMTKWFIEPELDSLYRLGYRLTIRRHRPRMLKKL
ncbi:MULTISPECIES: acyltransferase family protein [Paenibacillus]|uniref:acyltransferase family protein n=1 Tax=Paenibacillus TaxID=44249 RepID=UPI000839684E|nr:MULTISPECIES: hypothetical protein [Paenibacillus]GIP21153.1 putative membrane-bound acyltransferase YkrP [Paenibacillus sp. J22TS3]